MGGGVGMGAWEGVNQSVILYHYSVNITFTFSHLANTFIQSDLQMRTMEAIKINKRAMICKCYNKSQLPKRGTRSKFFFYYIINKKKTDRIEKE